MKRGFIIGILLIASSLLVWYTTSRRTLKKTPPTASIEMIIVGTNAEYQPFTFVEGEQIVGFDIDLIKEVCSRLGAEMVLKNMPFVALIPALQRGEIHVVAAGMTPTKEREEQVLFTQPYIDKDPLLIVSLMTSPSFKSVEELTGKKVIVNEGYISDTYMSGKTGPTLERVGNPTAGFAALKEGRGDALVIAQSSAQPFLDLHGKTEFYVTPIAESVNNYALAISKKYPALLPRIQTTLDEIMKDGTLDNLKKKWALQ